MKLVIDIPDEVLKTREYCKYFGALSTKLIEIIESGIPLEEKQTNTAEWIRGREGIKVTEYKCSACGRIVCDDTGYDVTKDYPYCHCGCRMKGENQ